jgi:hypothetical protein
LDWQAALNKSPEERVEHLRATADFIRDREKWELHGWLHQNLTILDGKAGTAFQVNATALALLTFFITGQETELSIAIKIALVVPFAFLLWSTIQLSRIAFVYWSTTADFRNPDHMLDELLRVRDERSRIVRTSWLRAVASLVFVAGIVAADLFF